MSRVELIVEMLASELSKEEASELIMRLDARIGEWAFSLSMADHFDGLRLVHAVEHALEHAKDVDGRRVVCIVEEAS